MGGDHGHGRDHGRDHGHGRGYGGDHGRGGVPPELDARFEAVVFDWDGTAVPDRRSDARRLRRLTEALSAAGLHQFVVTGTHVANIDDQLRARPAGPGRLFFCCNRGSEVFAVRRDGPSLVHRRRPTRSEDRALDRAAQEAAQALDSRGLEVAVVATRLNRRKLDLIPVPEWSDPKKADIAALAAAVGRRLAAAGIGGLPEAVAVVGRAATSAGVVDPRITSDAKHVEVGLTDKSDSAGWAARWLAGRGIGGELVLVVGDELGPIGGIPGSDSRLLVAALGRAVVASVGVEPGRLPDGVLRLGGGPARFLDVMEDQLHRRATLRVPRVDRDPAWVVPLPASPAAERVAEALGTLANGRAGTRASREEEGPGASPQFAVAGTYDADDRLLHGPTWTGTRAVGAPPAGQDDDRLLDLRTGTLSRRAAGPPAFRSLRLVSAATVHGLAFRAEGPPGAEPGPGGGGGTRWTAQAGNGNREITVVARDRHAAAGPVRMVERLAAWSTGRAGGRSGPAAGRRLDRLEATGFDALLSAHRVAWARRWADAQVDIEGGADAAADQLAARFCVFHLLGAAAATGESAVGARGLTGDAYGGHVFWDADVFVLPALLALRPPAARAMLEYRVRRLPAARALAVARGCEGARFPWESAATGDDVTPRTVPGRHGEAVAIATGGREDHVVAGVAWAADQYARWTGDEGFVHRGGGFLLVTEAARYWASRAAVDGAGRAHLLGVMGPDEYHQAVDDNAYTNVMARWNLRRGADLLERSGADGAEARAWRDLADRLVDGWDDRRRLYEQFSGYFDLEPLQVASVGPPPLAVDVVLGADRVTGSQLIKQADVLMLHHLVPDEVVPGSLERCLSYYEPRTAHGSSLSPAVSASLLARAGQPDQALHLFRLAARIDLDDVTGTTAAGLHLASMGGVWQALARGFVGLRPTGDVLRVDPHLPAAWTALAIRLRFGGRRLRVRATHGDVAVDCDQPLQVQVGEGPPRPCTPPGTTFDLGADR
ncbi:MAG TPA: glycosyl hydrolase family 65 protein [Acidimicrobiales bacterium]|nr:glycosyl hydrolase family 65 protein [Acidimicrobiales bacterium]